MKGDLSRFRTLNKDGTNFLVYSGHEEGFDSNFFISPGKKDINGGDISARRASKRG